MNIFEITLDVDKHGNHESVNMRQGDLMGTTISATLRDHDVPMEGGDYDAFFCMTLPDRKTYYRTEAEYADGVVSVVVDEQYAAQVPGSTNNAYFELWDGEELKYTTDSFVVRIKASAMDGKPAESYDSRVEEIMSEMREVIDEETVNEAARQEAEAAREAAESIRATTFETNEAAREATFTANEAERESTAAANEQARADLFTANEDERAETFSENEDERSQTFETNESDRASTFASNEAERIATFSDNEDERSDTFSENEQSREDTFTDNEATRAATFLANESQRSSTFTANEARREATYNDIIQYPKAEVETTSAGQILHVTWKNEGGEYSTDLTVNDATSIVVTGDTFSVPVDHDGICTADGTARFYFSGWVGSKRVPCSASLTSGPDSRFRVQFTNATSTAEGVVRVTYTAGTTYDDLVDVCTFTLSCNGKSYVHRISATAPKAGKNAGFGTVSASVTNAGDTPSVEVTTSGTDDAKNIDFAFSGIQGADGISPTVSITDSASSHTVTITDSTGDHSYTVPTYADEEQAREDAWDALESTVTDARDEALSAAALARNVNGNKLAKTLSGAVLTADDAYAAPPIDAVIYGASEQDGTPTPSAPVPIESVDALTLCVAGRNLLDVVNGSATSNGITFTENTDGSVTVSGSTQSSSASLVINSSVRLLDGVTYTLSGCPENGGSSKWRLYYNGSAAHYDNGKGVTWTQSGDDVGPVYIRIYANQTVNFTFYPQLEIGPTATPYQPYVGTSTSIDLQGHKLRSLPDGTRDELTLTPDGTEYRVTLTQRIERFEVSTTDGGWTSSGTQLLHPRGSLPRYVGWVKYKLCNACVRNNLSTGSTNVVISSAVSVEDFVSAMNGEPLVVTLALDTPLVYDLGTVTLPTLPAPDMTVWANGGSAQPSLDVTFERDANMAESAINADVDGLHDDVTELRTDTDGLLTSTSGLRTDVNSLRTDTDGLRTDTDGLLANVAQIPSMLSQQLTAGAAGGITGGGPSDSAAWTERVTGGGDASDGPANIDAIRGRTVVWNQLYDNSVYSSTTSRGVTFTVNSNGSITANGTASGGTAFITGLFKAIAGHKYLVNGCPAGGQNNGYRIYIPGGSAYFPNQILDTGNGAIGTCVQSFEKMNFVAAAVIDGTTVTNLVFRPQLFDLTLMFGAGNEPSTVAEFEALYPEPYYPYDAGSLLPVRMEGVETTSKNLLDASQCSVKKYVDKSNGSLGSSNNWSASDYIEVISGCSYVFSGVTNGWSGAAGTAFYDANKAFISSVSSQTYILTPPANAKYMRVSFTTEDVSGVQVEVGTVATPYSTHWQQARAILAATYFPNGMRSAGSVYDELTANAAVTRVGSVDLGTLTWVYDSTNAYFTCINLTTRAHGFSTLKCSKYETASSASTVNLPDKQIVGGNGSVTLYLKDSDYTDAATFKASLSGVMLHYALATPTATPIDPPLNLTYRAAQGGTERITHTDPTAPPTLDVTYGSTADGIRDRALSAIAPVENGRASVNYAVGSYLIHDGQLCKVTTAIASGEAIGTNVTATTVMAEVIALTQ